MSSANLLNRALWSPKLVIASLRLIAAVLGLGCAAEAIAV